MKGVYLDYAATTPVRKEALRAMMPYFDVKFGNPGSLHSFGQEAMSAIDGARERVADFFGVEFRNILFCGSATEVNNLVIRGVVNSWKGGEKPRIIISSIEHESVLETARVLEREKKIELVLLGVDRNGIISLHELKQSLTQNTALVSIMYVNNEVGSVQPIKEISKVISDFKKSLSPKLYPLNPIFHTDAVQAFSYFDCSLDLLGVDLLTVSAHKCGGPKGIGILVSALSPNLKTLPPKPYPLNPIVTGGGQEFSLRSGTENVPTVVGCAEALMIANKNRKKESVRVELLRKKFIKGFLNLFPESVVNGGEAHSPHIVNIQLNEMNREEFLTRADILGVALSSGSACSARAHSASHVLSAMYKGDEKDMNGIRASFGYSTTIKEIEQALKRLSGMFGKEK
ncbi:MAG: cysteine desulfurase family protein [Candidatus Paceibacterota bacterium]|jgi:cysteine desulfurase